MALTISSGVRQEVIMDNSRFITTIWALCLLVFPALVFVGALIANTTGLPFDSGCPPYDAKSGLFISILAGVPLAIILTILSSAPLALRNPTGRKIWAVLIGVIIIAAAVTVLYQLDACH